MGMGMVMVTHVMAMVTQGTVITHPITVAAGVAAEAVTILVIHHNLFTQETLITIVMGEELQRVHRVLLEA